MKRLRFIVKGKDFITFSDTGITFLREIQTTKTHQVPYSGGNGFQVADNSTLLIEGTINQVNYLRISIDGDQTLNGIGNLNLLITKYPNSTQAAQLKAVTIDSSNININLLYNSKPIIQDMEIEVDNRIPRVVNIADFTGYWSDYDGDSIGYITLYNTDSNISYNDLPYIDGTPISINDINTGLLKYTPDDVDTQYNDDYQYTITDSQGNISN